MGLSARMIQTSSPRCPMESNGITLAQLLPLLAVLFSISLVVFGNTGGFYNTDSYDGNGTAH